MIKTLYKFLRKGNKSQYGDHKWELNKWYKVKTPLKMCNNGFHASELIQDALFWVKGCIIAKVEVKGESIVEDQKQCWSQMRVVKTWPWNSKDSVKLAISAARLVLHKFEEYYPNDKKPRKAIEAAEAWLANPCEETREAAMEAADAASAAASDAYAASAAASAAASDAYAAYAAASDAYAAASDAYGAAYAAASDAYGAAYAAASAASAAADTNDKESIKQKIHQFILDDIIKE